MSTPNPTLTAERYPAEVAIYCDNCGAAHRGTYMVTDECDQATRFGYARDHLEQEQGWGFGRDGDFCSNCIGLPTREQVWELIARVRDAAPRLPNDAATDDIVDALADAGFLKLRGDRGV